MTHFPVVVCLDDPTKLEEALAPFDENLTEEWHPGGDAQAKWDWWVTGGRWGGYFPFKPEHESLVITPEKQWSSPELKPGYCDGGPKMALDLDRMRAEGAATAREMYAEWLKVTAGTPEALPWTVFTQNISEENGYTIAQAREEYHSQPRVRALKGTDFQWQDDPISSLQVPEELYVERGRAHAIPGWAILTRDGRWMEQGQMGWWAMNDASEGSKIGYLEVANAYIDELPETTFLICVDCHI
jgi:hypothetical protein